VLATPFLGLRLGFPDAGNDRAVTTTRQAYDLVAQGFGAGANGRQFVAAPADSGAAHVTQDGWRIRYADWQSDAAVMRPKRIDLQRATDQAGDVSLRIAIDTWQPR
jgi:hypothetical protein